MSTACLSTFGASLPSVCVVTYLQRCGDYRPNSTLWMLHHGSVTLSTMQVDQCWPGWRKNARTTRNIVPLHTAVRIRSQVSAPRPIRRPVVTQDDTDNGMIGMHDSTMNDAIFFRRKKWYLKGTAGRGRVICWRCCQRCRRQCPDTGGIWSVVSCKGPTTTDANCVRTTRWTPPW